MRLGYLYFPRYPVQRRVLEQPSLRGAPVVLHVDEKGSQRVRFASGAALKRGIRIGATVASASALEPSITKLRFEPVDETKALSSLGEMLLPLAPGFQVDGAEGLWLDASAAHLSAAQDTQATLSRASPETGGHAVAEASWARRVLKVCRALGLEGRCVVGSERFTTQAIARFGSSPDPVVVLPPRGGPGVASLPLQALEDGWLGSGAAEPFRELGLSVLGELAGVPSGALVGRFGAMGLHAARLCRGDDDSLFVADVLPEVIEEKIQLDWPAEQLEPVLFALKMLIDRLSGRLQGRQLAAMRLTVTVSLESADTKLPSEPLVVPLVLARASSERKLLVELIRHRMTDLTVQQPITALEARVDEASPDRGRQLNLGDAPSGEVELEVVLSRLQSALGGDALFSAMPVATHRPEAAWAPTPLNPWAPSHGTPSHGLLSHGLLSHGLLSHGAAAARSSPASAERAMAAAPDTSTSFLRPGSARTWPKRKAKTEQKGVVAWEVFEARPPRLFREAALLETELSDDGRLLEVTLLGRKRRVESLHGPERLAGAWWSDDPYSRDYYRLQLEGVGQLWVYRDGRDGAFYAQGVFD